MGFVITRAIANEPVQRDFDNVVGRLFIGEPKNAGVEATLPPVDVREDAGHLYIEAELPGFKKEDVDVTLENLMLTITAKTTDETQTQNDTQILLSERHHRPFVRSFNLPPTVNEQSVHAKLQDGILLVTLDKHEEKKPRKISVS